MRVAPRVFSAGLLLLCSSMLGSTASAGVVNFGDGVLTPISTSATGDAISFTETNDGATLTFTAINNLVGGNRFLGMQVGNLINGLHLAGGGGSTLTFTMSSNRLISLDSYTTSSSGFFSGGPALDVTGLGVNSIGNAIDSQSINSPFVSGPLTLQPNEVYTFDVNPTGAGRQAFVSTFTITVAAVPEPASFGLLLVGVVAGVHLHRRKRQ